MYWLIYGEDPETHQDDLVYKFAQVTMSFEEAHEIAGELRIKGFQNVRVVYGFEEK